MGFQGWESTGRWRGRGSGMMGRHRVFLQPTVILVVGPEMQPSRMRFCYGNLEGHSLVKLLASRSETLYRRQDGLALFV